MEAICGRFNFKTKNPVEEKLIDRMCHAFDCYGLDKHGIFCERQIGIGIRGLNGDNLKSPLSNENGLIRVAFEGVIYNSQDIRGYLLQKGHLIKTHDYGELIAHLYEEMGEDCVKKINGMFIFALWDKRREKLLLFRDRLGLKSIFYTISDGAVIFASEIKSILQNSDIKKEIDFESLHYFLSYNYVLAPSSLFKNIRKLPPAHCLVVSSEGTELKKYWDLHLDEIKAEKEEFFIEELLRLLETAVKRNLDSHNPAGLLLSGGIDSGSIGLFMSRLQNYPIKTFTLGFPEKDYDDDVKNSHFISERLKAEHNETFLGADKININTLKEIIYFLDDPIADPGVFASYYISKFAGKYVKVALCGEGGDELFAGYESYAADKVNRCFSKLPLAPLLKYPLSYLSGFIPVSDKPRSLEYKIKCFFSGFGGSPLQAHSRWRQFFSEQDKTELLTRDFLDSKAGGENLFGVYRNYFDSTKSGDLINKLLYVDLKTYMPECLRMFDVMGKSSLMEVRSPFLDHELVEFLFKVPSIFKLKGFTSKYLLKKAMAKNFSHGVFSKAKRGLSSPVNVWIKHGWKDMVTDILSAEKTKSLNYFNQKYIEQILNEHFGNIKNNSWKILSLLVFYLWHDIYINAPAGKNC